MKRYPVFLVLVLANPSCGAEPSALFQTSVLSQPVKTIVSQLQDDGTMLYSSRIDPVTSRITDDGSYCISRTKNGVTELYDINNNSSRLFKIPADFASPWAPALRDNTMLITAGVKPNQFTCIPLDTTKDRFTINCHGTISDVVPGLHNLIYSTYTTNFKYQSEDLHLLMHDLTEQREQTINLGAITTFDVRSRLAVNENDSLIAYGDQSCAYVYDVKSGTCVHTCGSGGYDLRVGTSVNSSDVVDLDFNMAKKHLAFCNLYGQVYRIDLRFTKKYLDKLYSGHGGFSVAYDKLGTQLLVGRSGMIDIFNEQGAIEHTIAVNNSGNIISLFCDPEKDTWRASTTRNTLLQGTISALARKKEHDAQEAQRTAGYDKLMEQFYLLFYLKREAERGAVDVEWTDENEQEYQELEFKLRSMGQELGINDFW